MKVFIIVALVLLAVVITVFVLENRAPVTVEFVAWRYDTTLGIALVAGMVASAAAILLVFGGRQLNLRAQLRNAETRAQHAESKLREAERQREMFTIEER